MADSAVPEQAFEEDGEQEPTEKPAPKRRRKAAPEAGFEHPLWGRSLTVPQVAQMLQVSRSQVYDFIETGGMPSIELSKSAHSTVRRIPEKLLFEWLQNRLKKTG